ncbi:MAG TPA: trp RNA-binding attenuation protein MtrB, partial [bacterium]|nr:trp RNA-binding attenuation protein MtrB [bacterium]
PLAGGPPYLIIKALEDGVSVSTIELSDGIRGTTMPERLRAGEVFVLFLDGRVQGYKIQGNAEVYSQFGKVEGTARTIVEPPR